MSSDKRSEKRSRADEYSSVEFSTKEISFIYQFKIYDITSSGMGILVKDDSAILVRLKVGDTMKLKYYPLDLTDPPEHLETEIKHITRDDEGRFKGHYLVGLSILEKQKSAPE